MRREMGRFSAVAAAGVLVALAEGQSTTPTSFLGGRYVATTDVASRAVASLDIEALYHAKELTEATNIYRGNGTDNKARRSLYDMSTAGPETMFSDQEYVRFYHALQMTMGTPEDFYEVDDDADELDDDQYNDDDEQDDDLNTETGDDFDLYEYDPAEDFATEDYAHKFIQFYLDKGDFKLAASGAVSLTAWMYTIHELRRSHIGCLDSETLSAADGGSVKALDEAAAFYIGTEQQKAGAGTDEGAGSGLFSLYALAHSAAKDHGTMNIKGEAAVNVEVLRLLNEAQDTLVNRANETGSCLDVQRNVDDIVAQMTIPLVQKLILHMYQEDFGKIRMYALAVIPMLEGCSPTDFEDLYYLLVDDYEDFEYDLDFDSVLDILERFYGCLGITCEDVSQSFMNGQVDIPCTSARQADTPIAGYVPTADVREELRLDLDVLQLQMFLRAEAYDVAMNLYMFGRNSRMDEARYRTLYHMATTTSRKVVPSFDTYKKYFDDDADYADSIIADAVDNDGTIFEGASVEQVAEIVHKTTQFMIVHMYVLRTLYGAKDQCADDAKVGDMDDVLYMLDTAWAYIVGSIEGEEVGGFPHGQGMYALARRTCGEFELCDDFGLAKIDNDLLNTFAQAQDHIRQLDCVEFERDIQKIEPLLLAPLIQGSLLYAIINADYGPGETTKDIATGFVFSRATLPLVNKANEDSAILIEDNMDFILDDDPVPDETEAVFDAYADALDGMGVECGLIGFDVDYGDLCDGEDPNQPTMLGGGMLFVASTNVDDMALIAWDQQEMLEALEDGDVDAAKDVYANGANSMVFDENGDPTDEVRTLKSFSTEVTKTDAMRQEPIFNIFKYALKDEQGRFMDHKVHKYADTFIMSAFDDEEPTLAAEAVVALTLWMHTVHKLESALQVCADGSSSLLNNYSVSAAGDVELDEAAAYYIGEGQEFGDPDGPVLYSLAEFTADLFETYDNGQAAVNANVLHLLNQAKSQFSRDEACAKNTDTYGNLRIIVNRIISQMTVPLIQSLIHYMWDVDEDRVKLYAIAVVPLIAGCNPTTFEYLKKELIDSEYKTEKFNDILSALQSSYNCLGISCALVGAYEEDKVPICKDLDPQAPLVGYVPATDDLRQFANLDRDILQMKIFMNMNATVAAKNLYIYGRNSHIQGRPQALQNLAAAKSEIVPQYQLFKKYFSDVYYADSLIMGILESQDTSRFAGASTAQKAKAVVKALKYQVMYMYVLRNMYDAVDACESGDPFRNADSAASWDKAVAHLVGSIEGAKRGGDAEGNGQLLYALSKDVCGDFDTCNKTTSDALVNDRIISLFIAGRDDVQRFRCSKIREKVRQIEPLLTVGLVQATLRQAALNEDLPAGSTSGALAAGDLYYTSIAPLVDDVSDDADKVLLRNMVFQLTHSPVADGSKDVIQSLAAVIPGMGLNCTDIGVFDEVKMCLEVNAQMNSKSIASTSAAPVAESPTSVYLISLIGGIAFLLL